MTQDTRKDRRVKIVSLNVRYKSATVDEFIENHAHDVSRGGIYIKTGSPFPPGTLLKFEIRLASDQAVITGVGRVVWKRDTVQGTGDRPSGMGVKFIKIDDPSKAVIDRLVSSRPDAGHAYESEAETPPPAAAAAAAAANRPPPSANRNVGKSTMIGVGSVAAGARPAAGQSNTSSVVPRPAAGAPAGGMFPPTQADADMPPKQEQTVMKQAAELLEEALREAGGTMEDVGTNPLFSGSAPDKDADAPSQRVSTSPTTRPPAAEEATSSDAEAERARAIIAGMSPASVAPKKAASSPPARASRDAPLSKAPAREGGSLSVRSPSVRPMGRVSTASTPPRPRKKKGGAGMFILLGVVAVGGIAGYAYRDTLFGSTAPEPVARPPLPPPSAAPAIEPSASSAASAAAETPSSTPSLEAGASAGGGADASGTRVDASATAASVATPSASAASSAATSLSAPSPRNTSHPGTPRPATTTSAPSEPTPPAATATSAPTAKPKPAPKPADDNPY